MSGSAVVFGASGGIGRAMVEALAKGGQHARIHAVSRSPAEFSGQVVPHRADLTDEAAIAGVARAVEEGGPVALVLVASGVLHEDGVSPEKALKALDPAALARLFAVNAIGPALVAKHFVPLLPRQGRCVFAALSARVGSIQDNRLGGWYGYRASKAALNQIIRTLAIEVARSRPEAVMLGLHPGTVTTQLSRPFRSGEAGPGLFTPQESAAHLLAVVAAARPDQSGRVLAWDGSVVPP